MIVPLGRQPRPRLTTCQKDKNIQQAVQNDAFTNTVAIRERLLLDVSAQTVRRHLREAGLRHRISAKKQWLTDVHRAARLAFAYQYVD